MKRTLSEGLALLRRALSLPAVLILGALLSAVLVACALLFTPTPSETPRPTEEEELSRMASELAAIEAKAEPTPEENSLAALYRVALEEEAALTVPFLFDAACDLVTEEDPARREALRRVLREGDLSLYLSLLQSSLTQNPALTPEEAARDYEEARLRLTLTQDGGELTPGESYALRLLRLLRLSLAEGRDLCRLSNEGNALSESDRALFQRLAASLVTLLEEERIANVPANEETLAFGESGVTVLLFLCLLLAAAKKSEAEAPPYLAALLLFTAAFLLLSAAGLTLALAIASPESLAPTLTRLGAIPFFPALLLRLLLRALLPLTLALAAGGLSRRTGRRFLFPALGVLLFLVGAAFSTLLPFLVEETSPLYLLLPDLSHAVLPTFPEAEPASPQPLFTLALALALLALSLALFGKKKAE